MQKNIFRKSLIAGIIILLVKSGFIPSIELNVEKIYFLDDIKTIFKGIKSSGYI